MKQKLFMLLIAALTFTLAGCSSDDEDSDLIGSWTLISSEGYEKDDGYTGTWDDVYPNEDEWQITFKKDGTWTGIEAKGTWKYSNGTLTMHYDYEEEKYSEKVTVQKLTSTELILVSHEIDGSYEYYDVMTFRRL